MKSWHPDVISNLEKKDYQGVIENYEKIITEDPSTISSVLYLGLANLLNGNVEEAQANWMSVFLEAHQVQFDLLQKDLLYILEQEAFRQLDLTEFQNSYLIREQILEINEDDINNRLHLINLKLLLNTFDIVDLNTFDIIERVKNSESEALDYLLLSTLLKDILKYPYNLSILFAESVLIYTNFNPEIFNIINGTGDSMSKEGSRTLYAINLLEMSNQYPHDNLIILINLYTYYQATKEFDKLIRIAEELNKRANSFTERFNAKNLLLNAYLILAEWDKAKKIAQEQNDLYQDIKLHRDDLANSINRDTFFSGILNVLYLQDDIKYNRKTINRVSQLFQDVNQVFYKRIAHATPKAEKKLTIGYVGHTMKAHSVGYLSRWLIYHHNRDLFKVNLYFSQGLGDEITELWFTPNVDKVMLAQRSMNRLINEIRSDQVDILVDLDSLTLNLTALVMVAKPAPVQVTWLGMDATGIPNIDYFIADPYVLPDNAQDYYSEKIWRLPRTYLGIDGFEIGIPTLRREDLGLTDDDIVYLNIQNAAKLNPGLIKLQLEILKQVQNSCLIFKVRRDENRLRQYIFNLANCYNIDIERLKFIDYIPSTENHRANLKIADIMLDTYPYNGATTTLEALWVGLPIVTKVGEQFAARNSYTFMINAGITEGIAWSDDEYIEWGIKLGTDENLRKEISWKLRQSRKTSPLWNGKQFARDMEDAYRQMWEIHCQQNQ